jgi:DNA-directed RNA polymerase specialized sigma24 family protein
VDDNWLVDQCLQGKTAYWNVIVRRYRDRLFEKVSNVVKNPDDAWEVVEHTFFQARTNLLSFNDYLASVRNTKRRASFFLWLRTFAVEPALRKARGE